MNKFPLVAGVLMLLGCGEPPAPERPPPQVTVAEVQREPFLETTEYIGSIRSLQSTDLRPEVGGHVTEVFVEAGERVEAGDPILQIDEARQAANVQGAQAAAALASAELERARSSLTMLEASRRSASAQLDFARLQQRRVADLYAVDSASRERFQEANAALERAEAEVDALDAQLRAQRSVIGGLGSAVQQRRSTVRGGQVELGYFRVDAPIAGRIGDVPIRVGDRVDTSTLLTTIESRGDLELLVPVPVERAIRLRLGLPVLVLGERGEVIHETQVTFVAPQVDEVTQTVLVKATLPSELEELAVGRLVRARLVWSTRDAPAVPATSVRRINTEPFVFTVDNRESPIARQRRVRLGLLSGQRYLVEDGLEVGDTIVVAGTQWLRDELPVQVGPAPGAAPDETQTPGGERGSPDEGTPTDNSSSSDSPTANPTLTESAVPREED